MRHDPYPIWAPLFLTSISGRFTPGFAFSAMGTPGLIGGASAWPANNRAIYVPFALPFPYPVKRAWWAIGTSSGSLDLGIFDAETGVKLYSTGATAASGTNVNQYVTVDWLLQPGEYYFGLSCTTTGATVQRNAQLTTTTMRQLGYLQEASANPLPGTMTGAAIASSYLPLFGVTRTTTGY